MAPKRISKARIMQLFFSLPEEQRVRLLISNLSKETIDSHAANKFETDIYALRSKPKAEAQAVLKKFFGDTEEHLKKTITRIEKTYLGLLAEGEYA